uniref:Maelstrom domain-containing protein n=1 Tax=Romanomermis culicivorax TaxID=13658 RepID=A0A915HF58_ROMCU
ICDHIFTGISVQRAVKTSTGFNVPSEISIVNFSWNQGILVSKFHRFIKPDIPRGFRADALRETEIHRIPPEGGPNCSNDLDRILSGMQDFVSYVDDRGFVFCADAEYETVRDCLKYIEKRVTSISNRRNMTIIRIADLFLALKWWNHMDHAKVDDLPTEEQLEIEMSVVKECLSRSCYTFKANIRCDFHKQKDVAFCSLSTANKSWLHLLDYLDKEYP